MLVNFLRALILSVFFGLLPSVALASGPFFQITEAGAAANISITLCLNGKGPLTCQNYSVSQQTLTLRTVVPNYTYRQAGIRINTAGYSVNFAGSGCTPISNGFCLFTVSNTTPAEIVIQNTNTTQTTLAASLNTLALSVNDPATNAALTGNPRQITITNTGAEIASNVSYTLNPALPDGTTIAPVTCGDLNPGAVCVLTITPGNTPSADPGDLDPTPIVLSISGDNTNTVAPTLNILTYGSVYQSGYLFSVDDTTPNTGSIGGTVASLVNQADPTTPPIFGPGIIWSSDADGAPVANDISGINENSEPPGACDGNSDGACNSQVIWETYEDVDPSFYAAGLCQAMIGDYNDWYLPAICELGYDANGTDVGCGAINAPTLQNIKSNLVDNNLVNTNGPFWSSTQVSNSNGLNAWFYILENIPIAGPGDATKATPTGVRCVRALTN